MNMDKDYIEPTDPNPPAEPARSQSGRQTTAERIARLALDPDTARIAVRLNSRAASTGIRRRISRPVSRQALGW